MIRRWAAEAAALALAFGLAGCGALGHPSGRQSRPVPAASSGETRVSPPRPGQVTAMPPLSQRVQTIPSARLPAWRLTDSTGHSLVAQWRRWPRVLVVAPSLYMGPLWPELRAARRSVRGQVVLIAVDWPPGTTAAQARAATAHALGSGFGGWPVYYLLPPSRFVPAPMFVFTKGRIAEVLYGVLPSAGALADFLNAKGTD